MILVCMMFIVSLEAEDKTSSEALVHKLIQEIKRTPPAQKRVKMNELKMLLRSMSQKTRNEAMRKLQKSFAKHKPMKKTDTEIKVIKQHIRQNQILREMQNAQYRQHQGGRR